MTESNYMNMQARKSKWEPFWKTDLHVHSYYSDGSDSPKEIIEMAVSLDIHLLAMTDHDTLFWFSQEGKRLIHYGQTRGIHIIPGLEISAIDPKSGKKVHILGLWPHHYSGTMQNVMPICQTIMQRRTDASRKQIEMLNQMGMPITIEDVMDNCRADQIFKHHIIKTLYMKHLISEISGDFYRKHFKTGGDCHIEIEYVHAIDAVDAIVSDHGYAVLAHPGQQDNFDVVTDLVLHGLSGIEFLHPSHTLEDRIHCQTLAQMYDLFLTGGSDYHGQYYLSRLLGQYSIGENQSMLCELYNRDLI